MGTTLYGRFHVLAFVLLAACVVGTPYAFGIFSMIFRRDLGYNQRDLSIVSSCGSTGLYTGVINGLAVEKYGPVRVLQVGAVSIFLGNIYIWLAVQKLVWHEVWIVSLAYLLGQMGTACATNVALIVAIRIFPPDVTGQTAGLSKGYFGASSAILATSASAFFTLPSTNFVLFVALSIPLVLFISSLNINFIPEHMVSLSYEKDGGWSPSLSPFVYHIMVVFACVLGIGASQQLCNVSASMSAVLGSLHLVVVFSIILIPSFNKGPRVLSVDFGSSYKQLDGSCSFDLEYSGSSHCTGSRSHQNYQSVETLSPTDSIELRDMSSTHLLPSGGNDVANRNIIDTLHSAFSYSGIDDDDDDVEVELFLQNDVDCVNEDGSDAEQFVSFYGRHLHLRESLCTWRMYSIMVIFCIISGSGLLVINNIQAVAGAVNKAPSAFFVTVLSVANACGRVLIGLVADLCSSWLSRFQLLAIVGACMSLTQLTLSFGNPLLLYPCLLLTGAMFGAAFSNIAALSADVFGSKYVGSNYGFIDLAPTLGSYIFSAGLIALFYEDTPIGNDGATNEEGNDDDDMCRGSTCFGGAFYVTSSACLFAACFSYFLHWTTPMKK